MASDERSESRFEVEDKDILTPNQRIAFYAAEMALLANLVFMTLVGGTVVWASTGGDVPWWAATLGAAVGAVVIWVVLSSFVERTKRKLIEYIAES